MSEKPSIVLTRENYHSVEADRAFMSAHQLSSWIECAAREKAKQDETLNGILTAAGCEIEDATVFLVGNYVDYSLLAENEFDDFVTKNYKAIYTKGSDKVPPKKRAEFVMADRMIERIRKDRFAMEMLEGAHQDIITYEWAGCWWKSMIDNRRDDKFLVDLKTSKDVSVWDWNEELRKRTPFYETYGYWQNGAIYLKGASIVYGPGDWCPVLLVVTKQDPPDLLGYIFKNAVRLVQEQAKVEASMPQVLGWKSGEVVPRRCEKCDYCRATKKLNFEEARSFYDGDLVAHNPLKV